MNPHKAKWVGWARKQLASVAETLEKAGLATAAETLRDVDLERGDDVGKLSKKLLGKETIIEAGEGGWHVTVDGEPVGWELEKEILSDVAFDPNLGTFRTRGRTIAFAEKIVIRTK